MKFLKQWAFCTVILAALCLLLVPAQAAEIVASGDCGAEGSNVTWTLDADGLLTISGTGAMADYSNAEVWYQSNAPWFSVRDLILQVEIQHGVTTVGDYAFYYCIDIQSVTLPNGITKIGESAFEVCHKMSDCNIPTTVTELGDRCFADSGITSVEIPYGITTINNHFYNCNQLTSITIPESVTTIGRGAFWSCSALKSLSIPDSVTSIGENMCAMCNHLEYVYIGKGITENDPAKFSTIFNYCTSLEKFEVSPENPVYCADEYGVLLNKDMTELIQAPSAMTGIYYVPDGVVTLRPMAFCRNTGLTGVVLSDSVETLGSWSLGYTNLKQVVLNAGLTTMENEVFIYSNDLTDLYFKGTEAQWEKLMKSGNNHSLQNVTIHYNYVPVETAITAQPENVVAKQGQSAQFQVDATGYGLTYQWQYSLNGGKSWFNSTAATQGYNTDTLTVMGVQNRDGFLYRCRITDSKGEKLYTEAVTLTVDISAMPRFTAQPASQTVTAGGKTVFTAAFTGEYSRVYWQYSIDGGKSWYASSFAGCETDALTVEAKDFREGFMYRCVLIDAYGNRTVSDSATLTVQ